MFDEVTKWEDTGLLKHSTKVEHNKIINDIDIHHELDHNTVHSVSIFFGRQGLAHSSSQRLMSRRWRGRQALVVRCHD